MYFNGDTTSPGGRLHLRFAGSGSLAFLFSMFESFMPYDIGDDGDGIDAIRECNEMRNQR